MPQLGRVWHESAWCNKVPSCLLPSHRCRFYTHVSKSPAPRISSNTFRAESRPETQLQAVLLKPGKSSLGVRHWQLMQAATSAL